MLRSLNNRIKRAIRRWLDIDDQHMRHELMTELRDYVQRFGPERGADYFIASLNVEQSQLIDELRSQIRHLELSLELIGNA